MNKTTMSKLFLNDRTKAIELLNHICPKCNREYKKVAQWAFEYNSSIPISCKSCRLDKSGLVNFKGNLKDY